MTGMEIVKMMVLARLQANGQKIGDLSTAEVQREIDEAVHDLGVVVQEVNRDTSTLKSKWKWLPE